MQKEYLLHFVQRNRFKNDIDWFSRFWPNIQYPFVAEKRTFSKEQTIEIYHFRRNRCFALLMVIDSDLILKAQRK